MPIAPEILAGVARRLADHAGLEPPAWVIEARASARIAALGCEPEAYLALIESSRGGGELAELIEAVRVGESRLFRHRPQIEALVALVASAIRARGRRPIRVWSAGCAAGEEPYTLAAVLARELPGWAVSILATDVSADALAIARGASYPLDELDDVPPEWRDAFVVDGDRLHVRDDIASLVRFEQANLVDGMPGRAFDLVWCRNVLIYFTPAARRRAIDKLVAATAVGGFVFVGYSESLRDIGELAACRAGEAVYYERFALDPHPGARADGARGRFALDPHPGARADGARGRFALDPHPGARADGARGRFALDPHPGARADGARGERRAADDTGPRPRAGGERDVAIGPRASTPAVDVRRPDVDVDRTVPARGSGPAPSVLALRGTPDVSALTAELTSRLAMIGPHALTIDLDRADLLGDELAPVLRRARAAARSAGGELVLRATRTGARRWLARHGLDDDEGSP